MLYFNLECKILSNGKKIHQTKCENNLFHYERLTINEIRKKDVSKKIEVTKGNQLEIKELFQRIINPNKEIGIYIENGYFEVELLHNENKDLRSQNKYKIIAEPQDYIELKDVKILDFKYLGPGGPTTNGNITLLN